ncbi:hypothetical protein [Streptomyces sp. NPDC001815]
MLTGGLWYSAHDDLYVDSARKRKTSTISCSSLKRGQRSFWLEGEGT